MRRFFFAALAGVLLYPIASLAEDATGATAALYAAAAARFANPASEADYAAIARDLEPVIEAAPDHYAARLLRIAALVKMRDRYAAAEEMKRVATARNKLGEIEQLQLRALAANLAGKPHEEIRFLTELAARRADDRWLRYELARAHAQIDEYAGAVEYVQEAFQLSGPEARWQASLIHCLHSKALLRSGGDPRDAIAAALAGRRDDETWRPTLYRLALAQYAAGDAEGGRKSLDEYVELTRRTEGAPDAAIQFELGRFFYELNDYGKAERHFRDGLALEPDNATGQWLLGYLLIEKPGGLEEGRRVIDRALEIAPNDARLLDARGWALYRANRAAEGYSWLRRAQLADRDYSQRIADHLAAVAAELKDPKLPPVPHTRWL